MMHGSTRQHLVMHGSTRKYLVMQGSTRQYLVVHGSAQLVQLLRMKLGVTWLVRQGSRALQQWGETSKCPQQLRDAGNMLGCALHLLEMVAMDTKHQLDQMLSLEAT